MKKNLFKAFVVFTASLCAAGTLFAQQAGASAKTDVANYLRVKKFTGVGKQTIVKTPSYTTTAPRSPTREKDWAMISVHYETAPLWIDEVLFQYYVLAKRVEDKKELFSLYRKTVKYIDVEQGRSHVSTVFLRPNTLKRYGEVVAAAVEIYIDGKVVDVQQETAMQLPKEWWKNPAVTESPAVTVREIYLLDRSQTPFMFVNFDDYEVIK